MVANPEDHSDHNQKTENMSTQEYTRWIIEALLGGINPLFKESLAGEYAPFIRLLIEDYDPDNLDLFSRSLDALKKSNSAFQKVLEITDTPGNPDYVTSKSGKQVFKRINGNDVWELADIDWLVSGILQRSTTTLVVGTGNVGKTFVWLDACLSIAHGEKWLGRKTRPGRVLYIYAEGSGGLKQRYKAWMIEHGKATLTGITDPSGKISFIPRPVNLLNDKQMLLDTIEDEPEIPEEVVIDTFSMCSSGVDENSNSEVAKYLTTATEIKLKYGCHVTIIHHTNKAGGFRGASALRDNVDTMITLDRNDNDDPIKVECCKQRDAEYFPPFKLTLKKVELGTNAYTMEPITSCVVEQYDSEAPTTNSTPMMPEKQQIMLELLEIHGSLTSGVFQKKCEDAEISKATFTRSIKILIEAGKIIRNEYISGKQQRVSYSLATVQGNGASNE